GLGAVDYIICARTIPADLLSQYTTYLNDPKSYKRWIDNPSNRVSKKPNGNRKKFIYELKLTFKILLGVIIVGILLYGSVLLIGSLSATSIIILLLILILFKIGNK